MKFKLRAALCAVLLVLALLPAPAAADWDDGVIFMAVNVKMLSLLEFMPIKVNHSVYVPITVFDASTNGGVSLGIYGAVNRSRNTYTMYNGQSKNLVFNLATGTSSDYLLEDGGTPQTPRAVTRNGKIYVTASSVCSYFDLDYRYTENTVYDYPLVRIRTKDSPTPDIGEFANAGGAAQAMLTLLNEYYSALMATPSVTGPATGTNPEQPGDRSGTLFQLAIRWETGQGGAEILDALEREGRAALLLFTPEQLAAQDDLARRAIGAGHTVGLLVPGESLEAAQAAIDAGGDLLRHIGRLRTRIVLAEGASPATEAALAQAGWLCWRGGIDGRAQGRAAGVISGEILRQAGREPNLARVTMDDSTAGAGALNAVLRAVRQEKYSYRLVVETELG